ncbi:MAG: 1,4-alpha-glucan-branching enzyme, partial [Candidatus Saccharimonas sp.]
DPGIHYLTIRQHNHIVSFIRGDLLFIINFSPSQSWTDYGVPAAAGSYRVALSSDDQQFGGQGRIDPNGRYFTTPHNDEHIIRVYIPARSGLVLQKD